MMEPDLIFKQISGPTLYHSVPAVLVSFWLCNLSQLLPCWLNEQTSLVCDWFICASHLYLVISKLSLWSATQNGTQWTGPEDKPALLLRWKMSSLSNFGQLSFLFFFQSKRGEWWNHLHILVNSALQFGWRPCALKDGEWRLTSWIEIKWKMKHWAMNTKVFLT